VRRAAKAVIRPMMRSLTSDAGSANREDDSANAKQSKIGHRSPGRSNIRPLVGPAVASWHRDKPEMRFIVGIGRKIHVRGIGWRASWPTRVAAAPASILPTSKIRENSLFRFSRIAAWLRKCGWTSWTIGAHPVRPYGTGTLVARTGRRGRSNAGERSLTPAFVAGIAALEVANPTAGQPLGLVVAARVLFNRPDQQLCFPRQLEQGLGGLVVRGGRSQTAEAGCASAQFFDWLFAWQVQTPAVANDGAAGRMSTP